MVKITKCWHCLAIARCQTCSRCHTAKYCQPACQQADWGTHRQLCEQLQAEGEEDAAERRAEAHEAQEERLERRNARADREQYVYNLYEQQNELEEECSELRSRHSICQHELRVNLNEVSVLRADKDWLEATKSDMADRLQIEESSSAELRSDFGVFSASDIDMVTDTTELDRREQQIHEKHASIIGRLGRRRASLALQVALSAQARSLEHKMHEEMRQCEHELRENMMKHELKMSEDMSERDQQCLELRSSLSEAVSSLSASSLEHRQQVDSFEARWEVLETQAATEAAQCESAQNVVSQLECFDAHEVGSIHQVEERERTLRLQSDEAMARLTNQRMALAVQSALEAAQARQQQDDSRQDAGDGICKICMDVEIQCALVPCGHHALCVTCARQLLSQRPAHCPICRRKVQKFLQTFSS